VAQAKANPLDNFRLVFADLFLKSIVGRMDDNADIFKRILDDSKFGDAVMEHYLLRIFEQARASAGGVPQAM
jgi:type I restriction enzyme R subunit